MTQSRAATQQEFVPSQISTRTSNSDQVVSDELQKQIEDLQLILNDIFDRLKLKTVSDVIETSQKLEQDNFSLYKFVVDRNAFKTQLDDELTNLQETMIMKQSQLDKQEKFKAQEISNISAQIDESKAKLKSQKTERKYEEKQCKELFDDFNELYSDLELSWNDTPDDSTETNFGNLDFVISNIDHKLTSLVETVSELAKEQYAEQNIDLMTGSPPVKISVQPSRAPSELLQDSLDLTKPLSIEELRKHV